MFPVMDCADRLSLADSQVSRSCHRLGKYEILELALRCQYKHKDFRTFKEYADEAASESYLVIFHFI